MTDLSGSASFEPGRHDLEPPSAKRARFETTELAPEPVTEIAVTEIAVTEIAVTEDGQPGGEELHLTVPQTQFEIEINSGSVEDEEGVAREAILQQDLSGPAFSITTASQVRHNCHIGVVEKFCPAFSISYAISLL